MDLDKIFDEMSEEEKQNYFNKNAMEYYQYIKEMPLFTTIENKLNSQEKLNDEPGFNVEYYKDFDDDCKILLKSCNDDIADLFEEDMYNGEEVSSDKTKKKRKNK